MITSDKQCQVAQEKLKILKDALNAPDKPGISEAIVQAARMQTQELIDEIQAEIDDYRKTSQMKPSEISIQTFDDLMAAPIRYRIASHLSVDKFARMVDISPRQIIRYESQTYQNSSITNLKKILECIHIKLNGEIERV
jgi:hypothetical protein